MKKVIICSLNMGAPREKTAYTAGDTIMSISNEAVHYPISAYLKNNMAAEDSVKIILTVKKDQFCNYEQNISAFKEEICEINKNIGANIEIKEAVFEFSEDFKILRGSLNTIIEEIDNDSCLYADVTYCDQSGTMTVFSAISFAERYLGVIVEDIICGKADIDEKGKSTNGRIYNYANLYMIQSIANRMGCDDPDEARRVLRMLLTM